MNLQTPVPTPPVNWSRLFKVTCLVLAVMTVGALLSRVRTLFILADIIDVVVICGLILAAGFAWIKSRTQPPTST